MSNGTEKGEVRGSFEFIYDLVLFKKQIGRKSTNLLFKNRVLIFQYFILSIIQVPIRLQMYILR